LTCLAEERERLGMVELDPDGRGQAIDAAVDRRECLLRERFEAGEEVQEDCGSPRSTGSPYTIRAYMQLLL
jgi:hypothetical protein